MFDIPFVVIEAFLKFEMFQGLSSITSFSVTGCPTHASDDGEGNNNIEKLIFSICHVIL